MRRSRIQGLPPRLPGSKVILFINDSFDDADSALFCLKAFLAGTRRSGAPPRMAPLQYSYRRKPSRRGAAPTGIEGIRGEAPLQRNPKAFAARAPLQRKPGGFAQSWGAGTCRSGASPRMAAVQYSCRRRHSRRAGEPVPVGAAPRREWPPSNTLTGENLRGEGAAPTETEGIRGEGAAPTEAGGIRGGAPLQRKPGGAARIRGSRYP